MNLELHDDWVPAACTLPTEERPLRTAAFDRFFAEHALGLSRPAPDTLRIAVRPDPDAAAALAGLAVRETSCCAFFRFDLAVSDGSVDVTVRTGPGHEPVLRALGDRVETLTGGTSA